MNEMMIELAENLFVHTGITLAFFGAIISLGLYLGVTAIELGQKMRKRQQAKLAKGI
ncbi:MAG: hypothetical protein V1712_01340 [Patescibacteria group bacterium]